MKKREWQIAIPLLLAFGLCLAAFVRGQQLSSIDQGIAAVRVFKTVEHGERVAVIANNALHVLDAQGLRVGRQDLAELGLSESPTDMDWTLDEKQNVEAWFFDNARTPRVVRCVWNSKSESLGGCLTAMEGPQLKSSAESFAVHLAVDRIGGRVFIADAKGGRVKVFDLAGKSLGGTDPKEVPLLFPNRVRYLGGDMLAVADNDHRRLAWVSVPPQQPAKFVRALSSGDHGQAREGRGKVTDAAIGPDGSIWMLAMKQWQVDGDVLVFDSGQKPVARVELEDGADPFIVEALGDNTALVADFRLIKLHRVSASGRKLGSFGSGAFGEELKALKDREKEGSWWRKMAMVWGALVLTAGLVLGLLFGEKPKQSGQFDEKQKKELEDLSRSGSVVVYPVVLAQTKEYRLALRSLTIAVSVMLLLSGALSVTMNMSVPWAMAGDIGKLIKNWKLVIMVSLSILLTWLSVWWIWLDLWKTAELRVEEGRLEWIKAGKVVSVSGLQDVYASPNYLLVGNKFIRVRVKMSSRRAKDGCFMFDMDAYNQAVLARINLGQLVSDQQIAWIAFKRQPLALRILVGGMVGVVFLQFFTHALR